MKIKSLLTIACLAAGALFAFTAPTQAQVPTYDPNTLKTSYVVSGGATSNGVASVIDCRKQQNVALQWTTTGPTTNHAFFSVSVDGTTYNTNHFGISWTNSAAFTLCTNIQVQGFGYLRLDRIVDAGNLGSTNTIKYGIKISSP